MVDNDITPNIEKLISNLDGNVAKAMANACAIVRNDAVKNAPHKTGALQRSIEFEVVENGSEGIVYSNLSYAPYVEVGTGIYATSGQGRDTKWRYPYYDGGSQEWATTEGMKAQPYLEPALTQNTTKIKECFRGILEDEKL